MIDDHWDDIDGLEFCPWVGPDYEKSVFEIRILVMGESTYLGPNETMEQYEKLRKKIGAAYFIKHDILPYRNGKWTARFWTTWINGLLGRQTCCLRERQMVLDNVAFWNYADGPPLDRNRKSPPQQVLHQTNVKLREVIKKLQPDLAILMSRGLWPYLSQGSGAFAIDPSAAHGTVYKDQVDDVSFRFLSINHPSGGFGERDCRAIRSAIEGLRGRQPKQQGTFRTGEAAPPNAGMTRQIPLAAGLGTLSLTQSSTPTTERHCCHSALLKYFEASMPPPEEPGA